MVVTEYMFTSFFFLQDAGYGEKSLFSCDDDNDDSESKNIDDEVTSEVLYFDKLSDAHLR